MPATKSRAKRSNGSAAREDAVTLLKADHRKVETLFKQFEKAPDGRKEELVRQICAELIVHTAIEEEIFYPACREQGVDEDDMDEAQVEHDSAKIMIADLLSKGAKSDCYDAKVKVLSEYIKHHVLEEEKPRTGIFAKARGKGLDLDAVGAQIKERKESLMSQKEAIEPPSPRTIDVSAVGA
jgi:hemerythrin HHE cation binding domain-containing protein